MAGDDVTQADLSEVKSELKGVSVELVWIKDTLIAMNAKFDAFQANYVPRPEIVVMFDARDEQIGGVKSDLKRLEDEHVAKMKQDIADMKNERANKRMNAPQWGLVLLNAGAVIVSVVALILVMVRG